MNPSFFDKKTIQHSGMAALLGWLNLRRRKGISAFGTGAPVGFASLACGGCTCTERPWLRSEGIGTAGAAREAGTSGIVPPEFVKYVFDRCFVKKTRTT